MLRFASIFLTGVIFFFAGQVTARKPQFPDGLCLEVDWETETVKMPLEDYQRIVESLLP